MTDLQLLIAVCVLVFLMLCWLRLWDKIIVTGGGWLSEFWRKHIIDDFPYEDKCWECNKTDCHGCKLLDKSILKKQK